MRRTLYLIAIALFATHTPVWAADATAEFDALFGEEVKRVMATPDAQDDVDLANALIETVGQANEEPAMVIVLCLKAYELAEPHTEGQNTAIKALGRLIETTEGPARTEALDKLVQYRQKLFSRARNQERTDRGEELINTLIELGESHRQADQFDAAQDAYRRALAITSATKSPQRDLIVSRIELIKSDEKAAKQIADLKDQIKSGGEGREAAAQALIQIYLLDKDDPAEARKYTFLLKDETLKENVRRANAPLDKLTDQEAFDLGDWYRSFGALAKTDTAKRPMLERAATYYDRFIQLHGTEDVYLTKAKISLKRVEDDLAKLAPPPSEIPPLATGGDDEPAAALGDNPSDAVGKWVELIDSIDPARHAVRGDWQKKGKTLAVIGQTGSSYGGLAYLPVRVKGNYELQIKFARLSGSMVAFLIPVGEQVTTLQLDYNPYGSIYDVVDSTRSGGAQRQRTTSYTAYMVSGLSNVRNQSVSDDDNPTRHRNALLSNGKGYVLSVKVQSKNGTANITCAVNNRAIVRWSGPENQLSNGWYGREGGGALGLGVAHSTAAFQSIKIKMTDGELIRLDNPAAVE